MVKTIFLKSKVNESDLQFLKGITILDAIKWITKAWKEVPESALMGVWNKLLINRGKNSFQLEITEHYLLRLPMLRFFVQCVSIAILWTIILASSWLVALIMMKPG